MKVISFISLFFCLCSLPKQLYSQSCISWQQIIGGAEDERGYDIAYDEANNTYWACGYVTTNFDTTSTLSKNAWIGNFSKDGILLNQFELKDTFDIIAKSIDIAGDILCIATTVLENEATPPTYRLYALNKLGAILWKVCDNEYGEINDILTHQKDKIVITGYVEDSINFDEDIFIKTYATSGSLLGSRTFGGSNKERANSIIEQGSDFVICGYTLSDDGDVTNHYGSRDVWLLKIDSSLTSNPKQKNFGSSSAEVAVDLALSTNNEIVVLAEILNNGGDITTSYGNGDYWVFKLDEDWNIVWDKTFGGRSADNPQTIAAFTNGDVLIGGITLSFDTDITENFGYFDTWLTRLNSKTGAVIWSKSIGGNDLDYTAKISINKNDKIVAFGNTDSNSIGCKSDCATPHEFQNIWLYGLDEAIILDIDHYGFTQPNGATKAFCINGWLHLSNPSYKIKTVNVYTIDGLFSGSYKLLPHDDVKVFVDGLKGKLVIISKQH